MALLDRDNFRANMYWMWLAIDKDDPDMIYDLTGPLLDNFGGGALSICEKIERSLTL